MTQQEHEDRDLLPTFQPGCRAGQGQDNRFRLPQGQGPLGGGPFSFSSPLPPPHKASNSGPRFHTQRAGPKDTSRGSLLKMQIPRGRLLSFYFTKFGEGPPISEIFKHLKSQRDLDGLEWCQGAPRPSRKHSLAPPHGSLFTLGWKGAALRPLWLGCLPPVYSGGAVMWAV